MTGRAVCAFAYYARTNAKITNLSPSFLSIILRKICQKNMGSERDRDWFQQEGKGFDIAIGVVPVSNPKDYSLEIDLKQFEITCQFKVSNLLIKLNWTYIFGRNWDWSPALHFQKHFVFSLKDVIVLNLPTAEVNSWKRWNWSALIWTGWCSCSAGLPAGCHDCRFASALPTICFPLPSKHSSSTFGSSPVLKYSAGFGQLFSAAQYRDLTVAVGELRQWHWLRRQKHFRFEMFAFFETAESVWITWSLSEQSNGQMSPCIALSQLRG